MATVAPIVWACTESEIVPTETTTDTESSSGEGSGDCTLTPSETEGPFPTHDPASLERVDIRSDREGVVMDVNITVQDSGNGCAGLSEAIVDIWHCDAEGYYSEYGGSGMQQVDLTSAHFLRGRQATNDEGLVTFTSIFPGWYRGRAPHIHVHIYDASGQSLLVTQIAFPGEITEAVYTTATDMYPNGTQDTSNDNDNVFRDGYANELATLTGSVANGYTLTHAIVV